MEETQATQISIGVHVAVAILAGWVSAQLTPLVATILAVIILIITGFGVERAVKRKGMGWWAGNGLVIYLFVWFVSWIYFFNLARA